jgi:flagellar hook-associated protein 3 FlgL
MRITFKQVNHEMQYVINDRYNDLANVQEQLATGKRLLRPSDSPVDVANDLQLRSKASQITQFKKNIEDGNGFMQVSDTAMMSMNDLFQRMRELAIQARNDTLSGTERGYINKEVEQLLRQVVSLGNTQFKGDYVFAGTQTKIAPFPMATSTSASVDDYTNMRMAWYDGSGGVGVAAQLRQGFSGENITRVVPGTFQLKVGNVQYIENVDYTVDYVHGTITPINAALALDVSQGGTFGPPNYSQAGVQMSFEYVGRGRDIYGDPVINTGQILREVDKGIVVGINTTADELMLDINSGTHMLDAVIQFGQRLLQNDNPGLQLTIGEIDVVTKTLWSAESKNGARINRFETTLERNEMQFNETTRLQSNLEDVDFAEAATRFSLLQTVYDAALKSAAKVIQPSLANYL